MSIKEGFARATRNYRVDDCSKIAELADEEIAKLSARITELVDYTKGRIETLAKRMEYIDSQLMLAEAVRREEVSRPDGLTPGGFDMRDLDGITQDDVDDLLRADVDKPGSSKPRVHLDGSVAGSIEPVFKPDPISEHRKRLWNVSNDTQFLKGWNAALDEFDHTFPMHHLRPDVTPLREWFKQMRLMYGDSHSYIGDGRKILDSLFPEPKEDESD